MHHRKRFGSVKNIFVTYAMGMVSMCSGCWVSIKSLPGRCFYFETFIPEYGALYDKLPISAFLAWNSDSPKRPKQPEPDLPLEELQFWNCFSYDITTIEKNLLYTMRWEVRTKTFGSLPGHYLFTIDSYNADRNNTDLSFAEVPDEHKSFQHHRIAYWSIRCVPQ